MKKDSSNSIFRLIFSSVEDLFSIIKNEIEIAKTSLTNSLKRLGFGIGYIILGFILIVVSVLFLLIALAYGFIQIGIPGWLSFLMVAGIMILLALILFFLSFRSFRKIKGIGDASRIGKETSKYLKDNINSKKS